MGYYYIIPAELVEGDNPRKALLYGLIASLANKKGYAEALNTFLGEKLKIKGSRVRELLTELETDGWIKIVNRTSRKRKIYISSKFNTKKEDENPKKITGEDTRLADEQVNNEDNSSDKHGEKVAGSSITRQNSGGLPAKKMAGHIYSKSNINEYNKPPGAVNDPLAEIPKDKELTVKEYITIFYENYRRIMGGEKFIFNDIEIRFIKLLLKKLKTREKFEKIINTCAQDNFWGPQMSPRILYSKLNYFIAKNKFKRPNSPDEYEPDFDEKKWKEAGFVTADKAFQGEVKT